MLHGKCSRRVRRLRLPDQRQDRGSNGHSIGHLDRCRYGICCRGDDPAVEDDFFSCGNHHPFHAPIDPHSAARLGASLLSRAAGECTAVVAKPYADVDLAGAGTCSREERVHDLEAMQEGDPVLVS